MTSKLLTHILATSLICCCLYLPAKAAEQKKSPENLLADGYTCLKQANIDCAKLIQAQISSTSVYAKLLQGSIALATHDTEEALRLLLPLQSEKNLSATAKINLHHQLASIFETLNDPLQAIQHLIEAEANITLADTGNRQSTVTEVHQTIWQLLNAMEQDQLIAMRGNNTDNTIQGWIDLCLASKNQDFQASIKDWHLSYSDHPAIEFAKNLSQERATRPDTSARLEEGGIALLIATSSSSNDPSQKQADAFMLGLQTALNKHGLRNKIAIYHYHAESADAEDGMSKQATLAKNEGNTFLVVVELNALDNHLSDKTQTAIYQDSLRILHIGLPLNDEANRLVDFALNNGMQNIAIVTTDNAPAQQMLSSFNAAWQQKAGISNPTKIITLAQPFNANDANLHDLKAKIASQPHDAVLLAMPDTDTRVVRPYLDISIPTLTFSSINNASNYTLGALRFADIPFLIDPHQPRFQDYKNHHLDSTQLLRTYALGVDALQLLIANYQQQQSEVIIHGLTGTLTIDKSGAIKRQLSMARLTPNGIEPE